MKILIFSYTGLGNFILKTPLIKFIKNNINNSSIDIICGTPWGVENVLKNSDYLNNIYTLPNNVSYLKKIKFLCNFNNKYDLVLFPFDATPTWSLLIMLFVKANKKIIHVNFSINIIKQQILILLHTVFSKNIRIVPILTGRHEIDLNYDLIEPLFKSPIERNYETVVFYEKIDLFKFDLPSKYIVIQIGASNGLPTPKTWNPKNFITLIDLWLTKFDEYFFVLVGESVDIQTQTIFNNYSNKYVINLINNTNYDELCNVLVKASSIISHDSGILHICNSLKLKTIALYGPTDYFRTRPLSKSIKVLHSLNETWCNMYDFRITEFKLANKFPPYYCLKNITVQMVDCELMNLIFDNQMEIENKVHD